MIDEFTIPLPPVTKKNSSRIIQIGGRPRIIPSQKYIEYERTAVKHLHQMMDESIMEYPVSSRCNVKAVYYMPTHRRVDLTNLHEALHDTLVKAGVLADDACTVIVSTDGSYVDYDKEYPRTEVEIRFLEEE